MPADYRVIATQPWTYIDPTGRTIDGFRVWFELVKYAEMHHVDVASLDPATVKARIAELVKNRDSLLS